MINFDDLQKKIVTNWSQIPDQPYRKIIIKWSGSGKTNSLLKLLSQQPNIDKIIYTLKIHMKQNIKF